jgi:hypothetical protein
MALGLLILLLVQYALGMVVNSTSAGAAPAMVARPRH